MSECIEIRMDTGEKYIDSKTSDSEKLVKKKKYASIITMAFPRDPYREGDHKKHITVKLGSNMEKIKFRM